MTASEPGDMKALRQHFGSGAWASKGVFSPGYVLGDGLGTTAAGATWETAWACLEHARQSRDVQRAKMAREFERARLRGRLLTVGALAAFLTLGGFVVWWALR